MDQTEVLAIIPAYNEQEKIGDIIQGALKLVDHVIVVDDGSIDSTKEIAESTGAEVVSHKKNRGLGVAIRTGYLRALELDFDIIVQLDSDGQYDPSEIPKVIEPIVNNEADMVLGSRLDNLMYDMPKIKLFGNKAFTKVLRYLTKEDVKDGQTGFRAMRREVLETALPHSKFSYTQEMIIRVAKEGWRIKSVPVHFYKRYDGESRLFGSSISFAFRGWAIILRTLRDYHPLGFFGLPGVVLMSSGFLLSLYIFVMYMLEGTVNSRMPTLILAVLLFISGMLLFAIGILADMIKTHTSNGYNRRPPRGS